MKRMKRLRKPVALILALAMVAASAVAFAGCGVAEPKTLEDYLADNEEAQKQIDESLADLQSEDMTLDVAYEGNKIIITCPLKTTYEGDVAGAVRDAYVAAEPDLKASMESSIREIQESTGIDGITVDLIVSNGDGSELWRGSYGPVE